MSFIEILFLDLMKFPKKKKKHIQNLWQKKNRIFFWKTDNRSKIWKKMKTHRFFVKNWELNQRFEKTENWDPKIFVRFLDQKNWKKLKTGEILQPVYKRLFFQSWLNNINFLNFWKISNSWIEVFSNKKISKKNALDPQIEKLKEFILREFWVSWPFWKIRSTAYLQRLIEDFLSILF